MHKFIFYNDFDQSEFDKLQPIVPGLQLAVQNEVSTLKENIVGIYGCNTINYNGTNYQVVMTTIHAVFPGIC